MAGPILKIELGQWNIQNGAEVYLLLFNKKKISNLYLKHRKPNVWYVGFIKLIKLFQIHLLDANSCTIIIRYFPCITRNNNSNVLFQIHILDIFRKSNETFRNKFFPNIF